MIALVVIAALTLLGESFSGTCCRIIYQITPDADLSGVCIAPVANLVIVGQGPNYIDIEVPVNDPDGNPGNPYAGVTNVDSFVDGSGTVHTEYYHRYCLGGNSDTNRCNNFNTSGLASGSHAISIHVHDSDGNIGRSNYRFTKGGLRDNWRWARKFVQDWV